MVPLFAMQPDILIDESVMQMGLVSEIKPTVSKLEKIANMVTKNKICLTGDSCSPKLSFFMNYLLGFGLHFGEMLLFEKAADLFTSKKENQLLSDRVLSGVKKAAAMAAFKKITFLIENIGYRKLLNSPDTSLGKLARMKCLVSGNNCNMATRRYQFFNAGRFSGTMGALAVKLLNMGRAFNAWLDEEPDAETKN